MEVEDYLGQRDLLVGSVVTVDPGPKATQVEHVVLVLQQPAMPLCKPPAGLAAAEILQCESQEGTALGLPSPSLKNEWKRVERALLLQRAHSGVIIHEHI